jgi:hypothetical protein
MLLAGDLRPLYLAWLACAADDEPEPPVPAGLKKLTPPLKALMEFYEISPDLVAAAAENSPASSPAAGGQPPIEVWLARQKADELRKLAAQLLGDGGPASRAETLARIRDETDQPTWPVAEATRTKSELFERAEQFDEVRQAAEGKARQRARQKQLAGMAADPQQAVAAIEALVKLRSTESYKKAAQQLADLREALGPDAGPQTTRAIAARIRRKNPTRSRLVAALRQHGLVD